MKRDKKESCGILDGSARRNGWSDELPKDLLEEILSRIPVEDWGRFASVCSRWHQVKKQVPLRPQLPWLMIKPRCRAEEKSQDAVSFLSLLDGEIHQIKFPTPPLNTHTSLDCCRGWLLLKENLWDLEFLVNPVTRKRIYLPSTKHSFPNHLMLAPDPTSWDDVIVWSLQEEEAIKIFQPSRHISEWRVITVPGSMWRAFSCSVSYTAWDGKLCFLNYERSLMALDVESGKLSHLKMNSLVGQGLIYSSMAVFLVESCQKVLLRVEIHPRRRLGRLYGYRFHVFKADLDAMGWVKVESLGNDEMLFLSKSSCFSVSAPSTGFKGNKIYYLQTLQSGGRADDDEFYNWVEYDLDKRTCVFSPRLPHTPLGCFRTWNWLMPSF